MRASLLIAALALTACRTSSLGACASDTDCAAGARCDLTQDVHVCVVPQGGCFPTCGEGFVCEANACVQAGCNPPCTSAQTCNASTHTCVAATSAHVEITSPAANGYGDATLQATASASAPGGVSAVRFELRRGGATLASAEGVAPGNDPSHFAATLTLASVTDGPADLRAIATYGGQETATSLPVPITVDQHAPTLSGVTDGRTTRYGLGQSAAVQVTIADGQGSGVDPQTVRLGIAGQTFAGTAGAGGAWSFSIPVNDGLAASGQSAQLPFTLSASDLAGHPASLSGDPRQVVLVDRDAPVIDQVTITPGPDYVATDGTGYYGPGPALAVTARIRDSAGVAASSVCLKASDESAACPHPGTALPANQYQFTFPRRAGSGLQPLQLTIAAADSLAAGLSGASAAEHAGASAPRSMFFDSEGPAITIAADPAIYARRAPGGGKDMLTIAATVQDPAGLQGAPVLISKGTRIPPVSSNAPDYLFALDASDAPAGVEGDYAFQIEATDRVGNVAQATGKRAIDDAAPTSALQIFKDTPGAGSVTYPAAVANTGYTGTTFVYSDVVHVKGSLTDLSGVQAGRFHVDGLELDGGVSAGVAIDLGCDGGTTCTFEVPVALNAPGNGAFHTGSGLAAYGNGLNIPSGDMRVVVEASDRARQFDGGVSAHALSGATPAKVTRFLWTVSIPDEVSGLAVHPDGDLIVTTDGGTDSVFALAPDQPQIRWRWGADAGVAGGSFGSIPGPPAIGQGDANTAPIYVAGAKKSIFALGPAGGVLWRQDGLGTFVTGAAVGTATVSGTAVEQVLAAGSDGAGSKMFAASATGTPAQLITGSSDNYSPPVVLGAAVFIGTGNNGILRIATGTGSLSLGASYTAIGGPYFGLTTDGSNLYAATRVGLATGTSRLVKLTPALTAVWGTNPSFSPPLGGEGAFDLLGKLLQGQAYSNPEGGVTLAVSPVDGSFTTQSSQTGGGSRVPLVGSDGHVYVPRFSAVLFAHDAAGALSWELDPPGTVYRAATMDCSGRLFVASNGLAGTQSAVYAVITDDRGLGDTAWPSMRRDSRNTGNAGYPKYGMRTASGCTQ